MVNYQSEPKRLFGLACFFSGFSCRAAQAAERNHSCYLEDRASSRPRTIPGRRTPRRPRGTERAPRRPPPGTGDRAIRCSPPGRDTRDMPRRAEPPEAHRRDMPLPRALPPTGSLPGITEIRDMPPRTRDTPRPGRATVSRNTSRRARVMLPRARRLRDTLRRARAIASRGMPRQGRAMRHRTRRLRGMPRLPRTTASQARDTLRGRRVTASSRAMLRGRADMLIPR